MFFETHAVYIAHSACLRHSFRWYSLRLTTEGWPGWVSMGKNTEPE